MNFCIDCGSRFGKTDKFCQSCGRFRYSQAPSRFAKPAPVASASSEVIDFGQVLKQGLKTAGSFVGGAALALVADSSPMMSKIVAASTGTEPVIPAAQRKPRRIPTVYFDNPAIEIRELTHTGHSCWRLKYGRRGVLSADGLINLSPYTMGGTAGGGFRVYWSDS